MKGLRKYLTPFAPDQSGAVSVLYELGGILVICDAGGCVGNVCGFDEPRWFSRKSAIFSAGLRDMDAILGRDDRLVAKLTSAVEKLDVSFAAIIGTPVPAVIGTDYKALGRMTEKKTGLPVLTIDTNGMDLYDRGQEKAWLALFKKFVVDEMPVEKGRVGIIGATPQDLSDLSAGDQLRQIFAADGKKAVCYGMGDGLDAVKQAASAEYNLVVSPSALETAKYLQKQFGTPYVVGYPLVKNMLPDLYAEDPDFYRNMRIQDLAQGIHRLIRQHDLPRLMLQAFDVLPEMKLTPHRAWQRQVKGEVETIELENLVGRVSANMILPYPPGVPLLMPGEMITEESRAVLDFLLMLCSVGRHYPGFETDIHGAKRDDNGVYWVRVLK